MKSLSINTFMFMTTTIGMSTRVGKGPRLIGMLIGTMRGGTATPTWWIFTTPFGPHARMRRQGPPQLQ